MTGDSKINDLNSSLNSSENESNENSGKDKELFTGFENSAVLRLPEVFIVMSADNRNGDKTYPGTVGLKYGPTKEDWVRLPYTSMKKLIDFCMENKVLFNSQLNKERQKNSVSDL